MQPFSGVRESHVLLDTNGRIIKDSPPILAHCFPKVRSTQQRRQGSSRRRRPVRTPKQRLPLGGHLPIRLQLLLLMPDA